ncbi:GHMP family kinase ATP-binding protein [Jeotgalibaca ciconiae]|uniref:Galactokinase n=1 Tax=Jeotgalibaca ciconiae TaxID=2496265 RepID=A0A3S9HC46_9LACT|nr:galactokinase family protein [Jeotgalibaca ciconiae]AZP04914.1 galactokinase [Jeotgalibaca ciconiae]
MEELVEYFKEKYSDTDIRAVRSPLRICPLGAHSDHQGGRVTGMTLNASVDMVYSPTEDGYVRVESMDFPDKELFHINHESEYIPGFWGNYIRGAVMSLQQDYVLKKGLNAIVSGKLPIGGLSSSAAVTTAYLMALCDVNDIEVSKLDLIQYSHWVETKFIGLKNGILDQSANILSMDNQLMVMDCKTNKYDMVQKGKEMPEFEVVVVYSGISKDLISTDFNNRVDEIRVAGWLLQDLGNLDRTSLQGVQLRDIPVEVYEEYKEELPERFRKRAAHFFTEQARVQEGEKVWAEGDIETFGRLMFESGESSFYQYESGIPEMKSIYYILRECKGVYGARPSGAGYRGAVIGLIDPAYKEEIKAKIDEIYPVRHPEYKDSYAVNFCKTADGANIVKDLVVD